jgi:hypothetical protein
MELNNIERMHEKSIRKLIEEFGEDKEDMFRSLYQEYRTYLERGAKLYDFIPVLTYNAVKQSLRTEHDYSLNV